ncbi:MAG: alpha/beta hydrolase-fold protein [Anaerolineae bacterium]|nr:alpha/beta hydrolase-fold protein [Anaerolineae bacterium]
MLDMFDPEFLTNKALSERVSAFDPQTPQILNPWKVDTPRQEPEPSGIIQPVQFLENGDIVLRMVASGVRKVEVTSFMIAVRHFSIELTDRGDGVFEGVLPAGYGLAGNVPLNFLVDGALVIHPWVPVQASSGKIVNFIEVPDPETPYVLLRDVPHGSVSREVYWSETLGEWERCFIYTPPGYHTGGEYPVLYLQHGGGENETCWLYNGKLPYILDNVLAEGKGVPFIAVLNNGLVRTPEDREGDGFRGIEGVITKDCRGLVESKYRTKTDKWSRAIAGLSFGSMQACYIGFRHPELFGSVGSFTYLRSRNYENTYAANPHLDILRDAEAFKKHYKLLFRSMGGEERHMNEFLEDDAFLAASGIDVLDSHVRRIYPGQTHTWNCWRRALYDFAQVVFK